jgi:hypothetical protein
MLHIPPKARTTPVTRAEIARSSEPSGTVAQRYGISAETVRKGRKRGAADCLDRSARTSCPGRRPKRSAPSSVPCGAQPTSRSTTSPSSSAASCHTSTATASGAFSRQRA